MKTEEKISNELKRHKERYLALCNKWDQTDEPPRPNEYQEAKESIQAMYWLHWVLADDLEYD